MIFDLDLTELAAAIRRKELSPVEAAVQTLDRVAARNPSVNAYITVCDDVLDRARELEAQQYKGVHGPLFGIPVAVKDIIYTRGVRTTMGSYVYKDFVPELDATVVERVRAAGGIVIGKANTHEFAYGPTGDRSYFGPVHNPHRPGHMTGGSSSGSAAALAAGLCHAAIGTDTGGSIRIPSALCGVVGMKPTYGRVSKFGVHPLSPSLDHVGPMTRSVRDNAVLLNVLAGYDARDPQAAGCPTEDFTRLIGRDVSGMVVGVPNHHFFAGLHPEVEGRVRAVLRLLEGLGVRLQDVALPSAEEMIWAQDVVQRCEVFDLYEETLVRHGPHIDPEVRERIERSAQPKGYEYLRAKRMQQAFAKALDEVFVQVDAIITPTVAILAPPIGVREVEVAGQSAAVQPTLLKQTRPFNLTGHPALSVPCGWAQEGLPVGVQLVGARFAEAKLYQLAYAIEQALPEKGRKRPSCLDQPNH